ncbi:MAG: tetratricopeptide repeat protein [Bacteroidia bacterium]
MKRVAFLLLAFCFFGTNGQNLQIDSLKTLLQHSVSDTTYINIAGKLNNAYLKDGKPDSALAYSRLAEKFAMSLAVDRKKNKKLASVYNDIGYIYEYKGEYNSAISYYSKALEINEELNNEPGIASTLTYIGLVYSQIDIAKALAHYFRALPLYERMSNSSDKKQKAKGKSGMAALYNNIGIIYIDQREFIKALDCYNKALVINQEINNRDWVAKNYSNLGIIYNNLGDYNKGRDFTLKSLRINEETGNETSIAFSNHAMGDVYMYKKEYPLALDYFNKALEMFKKQGFKRGIASCYSNIGAAQIELKNYAAAKEALTRGLKLSEEIGGWEGMRDVNYHLSELYSKTGKAKLAYEYYKNYILAKDSLVNEENTKKTVQQQMQYDFDKKEAAAKSEQEKRDAIAFAESRKQKIIIAAVSAGLVFILILSFVIFRSLRLNQKKNHIISEQKKAVEIQKELVEEKQREILDSIHYAKRIQMALLPQEKYISKKLKKL